MNSLLTDLPDSIQDFIVNSKCDYSDKSCLNKTNSSFHKFKRNHHKPLGIISQHMKKTKIKPSSEMLRYLKSIPENDIDLQNLLHEHKINLNCKPENINDICKNNADIDKLLQSDDNEIINNLHHFNIVYADILNPYTFDILFEYFKNIHYKGDIFWEFLVYNTLISENKLLLRHLHEKYKKDDINILNKKTVIKTLLHPRNCDFKRRFDFFHEFYTLSEDMLTLLLNECIICLNLDYYELIKHHYH